MTAFLPRLSCLLLALAGCSRSQLALGGLEPDCLHIQPQTLTTLQVSTVASLGSMDIVLLIDNSSSMLEELDRIRSDLDRVIVPGIRNTVRDPAFAVATFSDFGEEVLGKPRHPYWLRQSVTTDVGAVGDALASIELEFGGDVPESQLEALYQTVSGEGLGVFIDPGPECPRERWGGVCFRPEALPMVMLFTDAPMRGSVVPWPAGPDDPLTQDDQPPPYLPYERTYQETLEVLQDGEIRLVGLSSGGPRGRADLERIVTDTGTVDAQGRALVFDIGHTASDLGSEVVASVQRLEDAEVRDIGISARLLPSPEGFATAGLVRSHRPLRAEPESGASIDGDRFVMVRAATRVIFEVVIDGSALPRTAQAQVHELQVDFLDPQGRSFDRVTRTLSIGGDGDRACLSH